MQKPCLYKADIDQLFISIIIQKLLVQEIALKMQIKL